jgi:phosphoheptose isomerase
MQDNREQFSFIEAQSAAAYLKEYAKRYQEGLARVSPEELNRAAKVLVGAIERHAHVYVAGNGGSAAISDHLTCDWQKGTWRPTPDTTGPCLHVSSLVSNVSLLTAIGNDFGFENVFSSQLEMVAKRGDVLVLISSSGNSPNIVRAAEFGKTLGMTTIGLTGFKGGKLNTLCDVRLHVPVENYGIVEDAHQSLMHVLAQFLCVRTTATEHAAGHS